MTRGGERPEGRRRKRGGRAGAGLNVPNARPDRSQMCIVEDFLATPSWAVTSHALGAPRLPFRPRSPASPPPQPALPPPPLSSQTRCSVFLGLSTFFGELYLSGALLRPGAPSPREAASAGRGAASAAFAAWAKDARAAFERVCVAELWNDAGADAGAEPDGAALPSALESPPLAAHAALLLLARAAGAGSPEAAPVEAALSASLRCASAPPALLRALCARDAKTPDLRYALLRALAAACQRVAEAQRRRADGEEGGEGDGEGEAAAEDASLERFATRGDPRRGVKRKAASAEAAPFALPPSLRPPAGSRLCSDADFACNAFDALRALSVAALAPGADRQAAQQAAKLTEAAGAVGAAGAPAKARWADPAASRRALGEAWLAFLHLRLPSTLLEPVLTALPELGIPAINEPLRLADLLTARLDGGGLPAALALHAIFLLVTRHGLEYPRFYERLYTLLDARTVRFRHRARLLSLTDAFLASPMVPAATAAAFAKRFARLALQAEPPVAAVCVAFVHNLVRRHPALEQLLHREGGVDGDAAAAPSDAAEGPSAAALPAVYSGVDPYDPGERDPMRSRALESSLWEVAVLRRHDCPAVALAAESLDEDLTDRRKTAEVDVGALVAISTAAMVDRELARKIKQAPLRFHRDPPESLLGSAPAVDFAGWQDA